MRASPWCFCKIWASSIPSLLLPVTVGEMNLRPMKKKGANHVRRLSECQLTPVTRWAAKSMGFFHFRMLRILQSCQTQRIHVVLHFPGCTCNLSAGQMRISRKVTYGESQRFRQISCKLLTVYFERGAHDHPCNSETWEFGAWHRATDYEVSIFVNWLAWQAHARQ